MSGKFLTLKELMSLVGEQRGSSEVLLADIHLSRIVRDYYNLDDDGELLIQVLSDDETHERREKTKSGSERNYRSRLKKRITTEAVPELHVVLLTFLLAHGYLKRTDSATLHKMREAMAKVEEQGLLVDVLRRWYSEDDQASLVKELMGWDMPGALLDVARQKPTVRLSPFRDYLAENEYAEEDVEGQRVRVLTELDKLMTMTGGDAFYPNPTPEKKDVWTLWRLPDKLGEDYDWLLDNNVERSKSHHWFYIDGQGEVNLVYLLLTVIFEWSRQKGQPATLDVEVLATLVGRGIAARLKDILEGVVERRFVRPVQGGYLLTEYGVELMALSIRTLFQTEKNIRMYKELEVRMMGSMRKKENTTKGQKKAKPEK